MCALDRVWIVPSILEAKNTSFSDPFCEIARGSGRFSVSAHNVAANGHAIKKNVSILPCSSCRCPGEDAQGQSMSI